MEENITFLNDNELDGIVAGAFNQEIINKYDLKIYTAPPNYQGVHINAYMKGRPERVVDVVPEDRCLKDVIDSGQITRLLVKNNSGEMVELSKEEMMSLVL